ncbi:MAG: hypothetical protein IPI15_14765 [Saprospiraceae bacterium]|uniref:hypothetical protein n=1 Tax=Candidatus Brachybacter algidus TaxID=2982024 RepID=UPI00257EE43E|nr:hypothetical protein [Candidatus Brachybacter algidus]MBK7604808.1 hypothetical protein [Candidatus Brachybacter algidus]
MIAGYGTFPRFVDSFYIVDKALKCVTFKTLSEDVKISKDVYTDDVNFMWMMAGHHGLLVKGLLRDGASFTILGLILRMKLLVLLFRELQVTVRVAYFSLQRTKI